MLSVPGRAPHPCGDLLSSCSVPRGVNGRAAAQTGCIIAVHNGRCPAINHNAGDYTPSRRSVLTLTPTATCGGRSYNLHYGLRPAFSAGCGRPPWRRRPRHRLQQTTLREVGLTASAERASCPPGCVWLRRLAVVPPCSFPPRQLPLPTLVQRCHAQAASLSGSRAPAAKRVNPSGPGVVMQGGRSLLPTVHQSAVPSLAGFASPRPADPSSATASCGLLSVR